MLPAWSALLDIIIRDIPEPSAMAEGLVTGPAVGIGIDRAQATEIAAPAVAGLDGSHPAGPLDTADDIHLGTLALP